MVNWGILGLGKAANSFAMSIKEVHNAKLVAAASLSKNINLNFGKKFNIEKEFQFNTYEELINCNKVDAIYIATLNNTHSNLIVKSAKSKKAILCEKPMSLNTFELKKVFTQLNSSKVFFLENIAYRSHPQTNKIIDLILNDEIGDVIKIESNYGFKVNPILKLKPGHRLFNKKFGGGAINDIGCYPVSFVILIASLLQYKKKNISYDIINSTAKKNFRGTDDEATLFIGFRNLFKARLEISIKKKLSNKTIIEGTKGKMIITNPWLPQKKETIALIKNKCFTIKKITSKYSIYANVINLVSNSIKKNKHFCEYPNMSWDQSILVSKILNEWKKNL